jgi:hypothetical protein
VQSLAGKPDCHYVIAVFSNVGYQYPDPVGAHARRPVVRDPRPGGPQGKSIAIIGMRQAIIIHPWPRPPGCRGGRRGRAGQS